jgi:transketolase
MHKYEEKLLEMATANPDLVVMTAETRFNMRNIPDILGERFVDVGISEQNLIGMAAGMATCGKFPICHALAAFLTLRPFEFIRTDLGYPNLKAVLVGTFNGFQSTANGPTHQAIDDIALMRVIPNMSVVAPRNLAEVFRIFDLLNHLEGPMYMRYSDLPEPDGPAPAFEWCQNEVVIPGKDVAILSYGMMLDQCAESVMALHAEGFTPALYNMRFIRPMDESILNQIFSRYQHVVVVEDHFAHGGLLSVVREAASDHVRPPRISGINFGTDFFKPALLEEAMEVAGFGVATLCESIREHVAA